MSQATLEDPFLDWWTMPWRWCPLAWRHSCPKKTCGAAPGQPCVTPTGWGARRTHSARRALYFRDLP